MPATKLNYLVLYANDAQVYGAGSREIALNSPPPEGFTLEQKRVYFVTTEPDTNRVVWRRIPHEEVMSAELKYPKSKKAADADEG